MFYRDLLKLLSKRSGVRLETVTKVMEEFESIFIQAVEVSEPLELPIGQFKFPIAAPKHTWNFHTKESIMLPVRMRLKYQPSKIVKKALESRNKNFVTDVDNNGKD